MRTVLSKIWHLSGGLVIREVGEKVYVFRFQLLQERNRVLMKQPRSYDKVLMILTEFDGLVSPTSIQLDFCPFWVQIHGLPFAMMNERIGIVLGESIGVVESVDTCKDQIVWGKFLLVRVLLNVNEPLKYGKCLAFSRGLKVPVLFRYERLPDYCYLCGPLTYHE
ncbi:hypothetical protein PTKIN_Ptkin03bG0254800 [Pterospermum kingtungense]